MRDERRSFLKALALTPLAPAALAGAAAPPAPSAPAGALAPPPAPSAAAPPPTGTEAVAEALAEAVRREHGVHLDAGALEAVKKQIASSLESAARMRSALRLGNADAPITSFSARGRR